MFRQLNDHCIRIVILNKEYTKFPFFLTTTKTFSIHRSAFLSRKKVSGNTTTDHYRTQAFPRAAEPKQWWQ